MVFARISTGRNFLFSKMRLFLAVQIPQHIQGNMVSLTPRGGRFVRLNVAMKAVVKVSHADGLKSCIQIDASHTRQV